MKGKSSVAHNGSCSVGKIERHGLYFSLDDERKEKKGCKLNWSFVFSLSNDFPHYKQIRSIY